MTLVILGKASDNLPQYLENKIVKIRKSGQNTGKKTSSTARLKRLVTNCTNPTGSCLPVSLLRVNSELVFLTHLLSE